MQGLKEIGGSFGNISVDQIHSLTGTFGPRRVVREYTGWTQLLGFVALAAAWLCVFTCFCQQEVDGYNAVELSGTQLLSVVCDLCFWNK